MDPVSLTTSIISLATFIKDLIAVGQSIQRSIEKVRENRRQIRELTEDVIRELVNLADLTQGQEDAFLAPALLSALGNLQAQMLHVLSTCLKLSPVRRPGFHRISSQLKVWMKRDDLQEKIALLKEHVHKCYLQFTAYSAARIEHITVRAEQNLIVNNVENKIRLQRLEGLMARVLLETQFGQNVMNQTIEIIASDTTHQTLEFQYLSAEAFRLVDSIEKLVPDRHNTSTTSVIDVPVWDNLDLVPFNRTSPKHVLLHILAMILEINNCPARTLITSLDTFLNLGLSVNHLGMFSEATAWELMKIQTMRRLSDRSFHTGVLMDIAVASRHLSLFYQSQLRWDLTRETSGRAVDMCHALYNIYSPVDYWPVFTAILSTHSHILHATSQLETALAIAQEAVGLCPPLAISKVQQTEPALVSSPLTGEDEIKAAARVLAKLAFARVLSSIGRHLEAYEAWKEGFQTWVMLSGTRPPPPGEDIDSFLHQICEVAERGWFSLVMLADCVLLFRNLFRMDPETTSSQFLCLLHAHVYYSQHPSLENLRVFLEPKKNERSLKLDVTRHVDLFALDGIIEDAVWAFYTRPSHTTLPLIWNILVTHFERAIGVLQEVVDSFFEPVNIEWALASISAILPLVSDSKRITLLKIMSGTIEHFNIILTDRGSNWKGFLDFLLRPLFDHWWTYGFLDEALAESEQIIKYLQSCSNTDDVDVVGNL
ncbi:hypothetical protein B0H19DRAFT_1105636 [Mycena capillaripes]|nr:hypothetical protein B0H19DRAFT_1105636 [Mycena capillaripes]